MLKFKNRLKVGHFNEYLAHKLVLLLEDMVTRAKCYKKGDEIDVKKKSQDVKECVPKAEASHY